MRKEIVLPDLGTAPAVLSLWYVHPGDSVYAGDRLVEVLIGGATFDVSSPATGWLAERLALPDDPVMPGQVLGVVEEDADGMTE
jgi:pyruvate/2-oxoglutarate dehydrogenase complex dihydrolipoamide acyltransferase (E2) component